MIYMALIIKNAKRITSNNGRIKYLLTLSGSQIVELKREDKLNYNYDTQRGYSLVLDSEGKEMREPLIDKKQVEKIAEAMLEGKFHDNTISLNTENIEKSLKITEKGDDLVDIEFIGPVDICDGAHRCAAVVKVNTRDAKANAETKDYTPLADGIVFITEVTNLSVEEATQKFHQSTLGKKISNSRAEFFNTGDRANTIIKTLMIENAPLFGRVEVSKNGISKKNKDILVTFNTLALALRAKGGIDMLSEDELGLYITHLGVFLDELFKLDSHFMENRAELSKNDFRFDALAFYGYIALATHVFDKVAVIDGEFGNITGAMRTLKKISFDKKDKVWKSIATVRINSKDVETTTIANSVKNRKEFPALLVREYKAIEKKENNPAKKKDKKPTETIADKEVAATKKSK